MRKLRTLIHTLVILAAFNTGAVAQCTVSVNITSTPCDSACQGVIAVTFSGGQLPLTLYLEDGTDTLGPFTATTFWQTGNLCPGNYTLTVIDFNGDTCTGNTSFQLVSLPGPDVAVATTNATCTSCTDGTATATVTGGTAPYSFNWSNGSTAGSITGLSPGTYACWVVDANGCWDSDTFLIGVGAGNGSYAMAGQVYFDLNSNGVRDSGESGIGNQQVSLMPGSIIALTNLSGDFGYAAFPDTFDISYQAAPGWHLTSSPATYQVILDTVSVSGLDFGIYPDSSIGSAVISLQSGWPRCFWNVPYMITVHNNGFTILSGAITFTHDIAQTYVSSSVPPFSQIGNTLTFTYTNLMPGQSLTVTVILTEPAGGVSVSSALGVTGTDTFGYQFAQNTTLNQVITCSNDPNDKDVQPPGLGAGHFVSMDTWLDYLVRFQNTGTDTAFQVIILDTLDGGLDVSTFTLMGSSHPVTVHLRPGNEVSFTFDNILLPDSNTNEPGSHGFVLFRIKGHPNNPDPTVVNNTAYIYFDQNAPVQTNTTLSTFSDNFLSVQGAHDPAAIELFPNPAGHSVYLRPKAGDMGLFRVRILDLSGKQASGPFLMEQTGLRVDVSGLAPGTYLVEAIPEKGNPSFLRLIRK